LTKQTFHEPGDRDARKAILTRLIATLPQKARDQADTKVLLRSYIEATAQLPRLVLARVVKLSLEADEWLTPPSILRTRAAQLFLELELLERGEDPELARVLNSAEVPILVARMHNRSEAGHLDVFVNAEGRLEPRGYRQTQTEQAAREADTRDLDLHAPRLASVPWERRDLPPYGRSWPVLCAWSAAVPRGRLQCGRLAIGSVGPPDGPEAGPFRPSCEFHALHAHLTYGRAARSLSGLRMVVAPTERLSQTLELDTEGALIRAIEPRATPSPEGPSFDCGPDDFMPLGAALSSALGPSVPPETPQDEPRAPSAWGGGLPDPVDD